MADLWLISRSRRERLTDRETVKLGRLLLALSSKAHISYPDSAIATAVVHNATGEVAPEVAERVAAILGEFDQELRDP